MIIVKLMGGLGNQMFQYALGKRVSILRETMLKVDVSYLNNKQYTHTSRVYELNVFSSGIQITTDAELNKFNSIRKSKIKRGIQQLFPFIFPYHTIGEQSHEYSERILNSPTNSLLIGYWQSEKYFLPIEAIIRNDFTFEGSLDAVNSALAMEIESCNSVSLHVRRGDYVYHPETRLFHGICTPEYYYRAVDLIKNKIPNVHLFIFSDDMDWVKANIKFDIPATYVENNSGDNSFIDMRLISLCKHNIIANSSFSWWGAWLNNNSGKIVVAPAKWFNDDSINVKDVVPETWLKL
jgi:hypothetical protein